MKNTFHIAMLTSACWLLRSKFTIILYIYYYNTSIILRGQKQRKIYEPSGVVARRDAQKKMVRVIDGVPICHIEFGECRGLPAENGKFYIVSQLIKLSNPDRSDLLVPSEIDRDDDGNIIGCYSLGI